MKATKHAKKLDMLNGSIWNKLPLYALPVAATGILEQLFNASDIAIVGNFASSDRTVAIAAVGANSPIIGVILNLFIGISLGTVVIAASSAAFNIEILVYYVFNSFSQACTTFVGQNYGAGQIQRCKRTFLLCLIEDSITSVAAIILILCSGRFLLSLFNRDPQVITLGYERLVIIFTAYCFSMLYEIISGYLRGFGISLVPAILTIIGVCGTRIAWVYAVFPKDRTFHTLLIAYPVSLAITAVLILAAVCIYHPAHQNQTPD